VFYIVFFSDYFMDDKSIMVNLGDEKAKEISEVIGSKTCNRILGLLSEEILTVSEISKKLKMPMNTVDYNIKKLVKAGLIEKSSHWWSVKGKKMPTYKVSNRKIIISPKKSIAKVFAWTIGLTGLMALTIREFFSFGSENMITDTKMRMTETVMSAVSSDEVSQVGGAFSDEIVNPVWWNAMGPWSWFLLGAWIAVFLFFVITLINDKRHKL